jgi:cell division septation protein DedD
MALCLALAAHAAEPVRVEAVQYPAWLERGGREVPLTPGIALAASDQLRTGANARVQLKLSEGSTVKLGENARFIVERVQDRGIFRSTMHVVLGAFRFTTGVLGVGRKRDIQIQVRTVTAGIRGTDVWGKSTEARDLVCLLEGRVSVAAEGSPQVTLDKPRDFYQRPRDGAPQVGSVDAKQIEEWSRETEIQPDAAAASLGGRWRVVASKFARREEALALRRELRARGYPAELVSSESDVHRVEIGGLSGEPQARALMATLRTIPGVGIPSVVESATGSR